MAKKHVATLEIGKKHWVEGVKVAKDDYRKNVAKFLGVSPEEITVADAWFEGVKGKADIWAKRLKEGMTT